MVITGPSNAFINLGGATITVTTNASGNTLQFEASGDSGTTWVALNATPSNSTTAATSTTSTGVWQANVAGYTNLRVRCSTFVSGTATVSIVTSTASARSGGGGGGVTPGGAGTIVGGTGGGTAQVQTLTPSPAITSYVTGGSVRYCWIPIASNTGPGTTLNISGLGAKTITKNPGGTLALINNDILINVIACADWDGTNMELENPQAGIGAFTSVTNYGAGTQEIDLYPSGGCTGPSATPSCTGNHQGFITNPTLSASSVWQLPTGDAPSAGGSLKSDAAIHLSWSTGCALTVDATNCNADAESSAATNGTLTSGFANQTLRSITTASNSTSTPLSVVQGSITNTVATPALQIKTTWNNAGLAARGFVFNTAITAAAAGSRLFDWQITGTTKFSLGRFGTIGFGGGGGVTSQIPDGAPASLGAWKYDMSGNNFGTGVDQVSEYHDINATSAGWFAIGANTSLVGNDTATTPDSNFNLSLFNKGLGILGTEIACSGSITNGVTASVEICGDSTAHELLVATNNSTNLGMLVRRQPGQINSTGLTALVANGTTLCAASAGACNVAGQYHIHINVWGSGTACGTPSPGGVTPNLSWTDENAVAHANVVIPMMSQTGAATTVVNVTAPTVAFQSALANEGGSGDFTISTNGTVIQYGVAYAACGAGTGTYNLRISVTRLQ